MTSPRAVAYIRVAEARPERDAQKSAIEAWAERERVTVAAWQIDEGISGATPIAERPGLVAAYRALREHRAVMLVASQADRFATPHDELVAWLIERAALTEGAQLRTADGSAPVSSPPAVRSEEPLESYTRGAVDLARAYQRVVVRGRIRAALADKRARGERVGTVPYGYRLAADGRHVEPNADEQSVIQTVRDLAKAGLSQRTIVARLAERGVAGRTGAPLRQTQVAKILRSAP